MNTHESGPKGYIQRDPWPTQALGHIVVNISSAERFALTDAELVDAAYGHEMPDEGPATVEPVVPVPDDWYETIAVKINPRMAAELQHPNMFVEIDGTTYVSQITDATDLPKKDTAAAPRNPLFRQPGESAAELAKRTYYPQPGDSLQSLQTSGQDMPLSETYAARTVVDVEAPLLVGTGV